MQDDIIPTQDKETTSTDSPSMSTSSPESIPPSSVEPATSTGPRNDTLASTSPFEAEMTQPVDVASEAPSPVAPIASGKSNKKKKLIIVAVVIAVLAVLAGTGVAAYNLWFQNPDKVLGDALVNAVRAKTISYTGSLDYKAKTTTSSFSPSHMKLTVDGKNTSVDGEMNVKLALTYGGKDFNLSGSGLYDKDANLYFKINDVRKIIDNALSSSSVVIPQEIDNLITKIDGKWIKISVDDTKEFSEKYADTQKCTKDTLKKYENDKDATKEIVDLYNKNKFIVVKEKLGSKDGSLGYAIEGDTDKTKAFVKGLNDTKIVKELQKCDENFKLDADDINGDSTTEQSDGQFEVWVDRWSHQFTKFNLTGKDDDGGEATFIVEPKFNQTVSINVPKDTVSLSELKADIEKIQQDYTNSLKDSTTTLDSDAMTEV